MHTDVLRMHDGVSTDSAPDAQSRIGWWRAVPWLTMVNAGSALTTISSVLYLCLVLVPNIEQTQKRDAALLIKVEELHKTVLMNGADILIQQNKNIEAAKEVSKWLRK